MTRERVALIRERLIQELDATDVNVVDEGHKHIGHAGAATGLGHFAVTLRCARFAGQPLLHRHRMVYSALGELMQTDIHALSIRARAPEEPE